MLKHSRTSRGGLRTTIRRSFLATWVAAAVLLAGTQPASAATFTDFNKPVDGPSGTSAKIRSTHGGNGLLIPLREGKAGYGYQHILAGGSHGRTHNHEVTAFAQKQWNAAIANAKTTSGRKPIPGRFPNSWVYTHVYSTPSGIRRTMCVVVDNNDLVFASKTWGQKGIITAFWMTGDLPAYRCNEEPA